MGDEEKIRGKIWKVYVKNLWLKTSLNRDSCQNADAKSREGSNTFQQKENIKVTESWIFQKSKTRENYVYQEIRIMSYTKVWYMTTNRFYNRKFEPEESIIIYWMHWRKNMSQNVLESNLSEMGGNFSKQARTYQFFPSTCPLKKSLSKILSTIIKYTN